MPPEPIAAAVEVTQRYIAGLVFGFLKEREERILKEQEELRQALAKALATQSEELLFKNHAVDTSMNGILLADLSVSSSTPTQDSLRSGGTSRRPRWLVRDWQSS